MPGAEREKAVAEWPEEKRKVLLQKLEAYKALSVEECERRLRMLELRWYVRPLMAMTLDERKGALPFVPAYLRQIVVQRLQHWDSLSPESRREILANDNARELVTQYYLQLQQGRSKEEILTALRPEKRAELDEALKTWNSLSPSARGRTAAQLTSFFQLPKQEQARAFGEMSETERLDIERTLEAFAQLSPEQRRICIESFQKFTMMPPPERASFLRNAARWQTMTPEERATWKNLVTKLPPLPPAPVSLPPAPASSQTRGKVAQSTAQ